MLRSGSAPILFLLPYLFFQSRDLECHLTFPRDLCHMASHLIGHLTTYHMTALLF